MAKNHPTSSQKSARRLAFTSGELRYRHTELSIICCRLLWKSRCGLEMTAKLNQLVADTMTLRDLYKKSHWQVAGPTFYQLHLLFDKHFEEQVELVDSIAKRIQLLGGVSIAMAPDVAETMQIEQPSARPRGGSDPALHACSMRIRSSFVKLARRRGVRQNLAMMAVMIFLSAMCCARTSYRCGF
jgi:hypothetical protein